MNVRIYNIHFQSKFEVRWWLFASRFLCSSPLERAQEPAESQREEEEEAAADGDEEEALLVPQVKVAEDGTLIIDESRLVHLYCFMDTVQVANGFVNFVMSELHDPLTAFLSLTVEVQRAKGPNLIQDRDPIFERGSTTTYSSFRKGNYSKPWSTEGLAMFNIRK